MKKGVALPWWSDRFALVWSFWYIFGDHDALALCCLGGVAIYLDAIFDKPCYTLELGLIPLFLEVILEDLSVVRYTWR